MTDTNTEPVRHTCKGGTALTILPSDRFKTVTAKLFVQAPLDARTVSARALLPSLLRRTTGRHTTPAAVTDHLEDLYGATLGVDVSKVGERHVTAFRADAIADRFVPAGEPKVFEPLVAFLREVLTEPDLDPATQMFRETRFTRERDVMRSSIESLKNEKGPYAHEQATLAMCGDEPYGVHELGTVESLDATTLASLMPLYTEMRDRLPMSLFVCGNIEPQAAIDAAERAFDFARNGIAVSDLPPTRWDIRPAAPRRVRVPMDLTQTQLVIGWRAGTAPAADETLAMHVFIAIFGGSPVSRLFKNFRERDGLAYDAHAMYDRHKSVVQAVAGVAPENEQRAIDGMQNELKLLCDGGVIDEDIALARVQLETYLKSVEDNPAAIVNLMMDRAIAGREETVAQTRARLATVTRDDVIAAGQRLMLDTVYTLGGE
jgi:predicted Zn-dependent peptidase